MISSWQAPLPNNATSEELLVSFDQGRTTRVLMLPALFDEANKLRRLTLEIMRGLDNAGIDSFLPDLPGCNESLQPLEDQSLAQWRKLVEAAKEQVRASHFLAIRAGGLLAPASMAGFLYAPQDGAKTLRGLIRARVLASKEAGLEESSAQLMELGQSEGLTLAGWDIGATMFGELTKSEIAPSEHHHTLAQKQIGGAGLWLRAEPDEDSEQALAIVRIITETTQVQP